MKYNKLAASLFFSGMLLLSGCGTDEKENSTPAPVPDTISSSDTTAPATQIHVLESTNITTTNGKTIRVDKTANGLVFARI